MNAPTMTEIDDDDKARETAFVSEFFARATLGEGEADILIELLRETIQAVRTEKKEGRYFSCKDVTERAGNLVDELEDYGHISDPKFARDGVIKIVSAALQAARNEERERCAKMLDEAHKDAEEHGFPIWANDLATAIREGK